MNYSKNNTIIGLFERYGLFEMTLPVFNRQSDYSYIGETLGGLAAVPEIFYRLHKTDLLYNELYEPILLDNIYEPILLDTGETRRTIKLIIPILDCYVGYELGLNDEWIELYNQNISFQFLYYSTICNELELVYNTEKGAFTRKLDSDFNYDEQGNYRWKCLAEFKRM